MKPIDVTIIGGGMITNDLLLPAIYHLQRMDVVGKVMVCALNSAPLQTLRDNPDFQSAFPGQEFIPYPDFSESPDRLFPNLYKEVLMNLPPRQAVVVAVPDQFHYPVLKEALSANQHVLCVKPLVQEYRQTQEIEKVALDKGLFVGVEYHKRFDRRYLIARRDYRAGRLGEFAMGEAKLLEPYYYRSSNFQNWFTVDQTDPFVYIGCHYVDLVYFMTGLRPTELTVCGRKGKFPNGNEGFLWASGRVRFENGALFSVNTGLGYPDDGAGSNDQGLVMYCEGKGKTGMIFHDDQYRGVAHCYVEGAGPGGTAYNYINPDFMRLVPWEGKGYKPVGYGPDSISASINTIARIEVQTSSLPEAAALLRRRELIRQVDEQGLIATPANSYINELVVEAARMSILREGELVRIVYGDHPHIELVNPR
jgi:predicted dehydrogenase